MQTLNFRKRSRRFRRLVHPHLLDKIKTILGYVRPF